MATLLMNLRHVPDDEADEVRVLLAEHDIGYYETPPSRWGISMGGIWLRDDTEMERAKRLLAEYQAERQRRMRADYEERRRQGTAETLADSLRRQPLRVLVYAAIVGLILYLLITPFFGLAE